MFSKKATKLTKSSPSSVYLFDTYLVNVKLIVKILSIFVANLRKHEIYKKIFLSVINSYNNPFEIAFWIFLFLILKLRLQNGFDLIFDAIYYNVVA